MITTSQFAKDIYITFCASFNKIRACRITWDKGMPEGEVWVKLGGDKGGSCMKVQAQLCNVPTPNSPKNTSVFTAFEAPDTVTNLHIALERYKDQVIQLQSLTWRYNIQNVPLCTYIHTYLQWEESESLPQWGL